MKYVFDVKDVHEARFIGHKPKLWKMEEEHKPWMFDKAEELLSRSEYDKIVCLGDLVDDWDQEKNLGLYSETFDALERFINRHPNFLLCYGNHDVSYSKRQNNFRIAH